VSWKKIALRLSVGLWVRVLHETGILEARGLFSTPLNEINMIGRIYHIVDKITGAVIKVGSTIQTLKQRFAYKDYQERYLNHDIKEVRIIESSDSDVYEPKNPYCPFLWHLVAAEHMEILKIGTYRTGSLSNKRSPLDQKYFGFDGAVSGQIGGVIGGKIAGKISGRKHVESGHLASLRTTEHQIAAGKRAGEVSVRNKTGIHNPDFDHVSAGRLGGLKHVESGHLQRVSSLGGKASGPIVGRRNADSGRMCEVQKMGLGLGGLIGGPKGMHIRWHVNRGIISLSCKHCQVKNA